MLRIGALQGQWVMQDRSGVPFVGRQQLIVENFEHAKWKDRKGDWNWGLRSGRNNALLRCRRGMRKGIVTMENPSVDVESTAQEGDQLLMDKPVLKRGSSSLNSKINKAVIFCNSFIHLTRPLSGCLTDFPGLCGPISFNDNFLIPIQVF